MPQLSKAVYTLRLLGSFELRVNGEMISLRRKTRGLLAYLAVTETPPNRSILCDFLFAESNNPLGALRWQLSQIRSNLGTDALAQGSDLVQLNRDTFWIDVTEYEQKLTQSLTSNDLAELQSAVDIPRGEFLEQLDMPDSPQFELWLLSKRAEFHQRQGQALMRLVQGLINHSRYVEALSYAQQLLLLEPLQEEAHHHLIWFYAQTGQRKAAIQQFEKCRDIWHAEFGEEPSATLRTLVAEIASRPVMVEEIAIASEIEFSGRSEQVGSSATALMTTIAPPLVPSSPYVQKPQPSVTFVHNLPTDPLPFVGRKQEMAELHRLLVKETNCRLLTIVGPGGMGKTRLAIETARAFLPTSEPALISTPSADTPDRLSRNDELSFADGIFFVPLNPVGTTEEITAAITGAVTAATGDSFYAETPLDAQLLNYLREKNLLLILDNFEHLLDGAPFVSKILATAPDVAVLVTSRSALNLREEWFYPLEGLAYPTEDGITYGERTASPNSERLLEEMTRYDAVRLFVQSASRANVGFAPAAEIEHILRICQLVEGMPLALELAAVWLRTLPASKIAEEIARGLNLLTTRQQNMPQRHRSMRLLLEESWQVLSAEEQMALSRLSIFRGGFCADAAETVAEISFGTIATLADSFLIRFSQSNVHAQNCPPERRYRIHELLRQFAYEQLQKEPQLLDRTCTLHSHYYLDQIGGYTNKLSGKEQAAALMAIDDEIGNVYVAWQWAVVQGDFDRLGAATESFYQYQQLRGRYRQGQATFEQALAALSSQEQAHATESVGPSESTESSPTAPAQVAVLRCLWLARLGAFCNFTNEHDQSIVHLEESLALARQLNRPIDIAFALMFLGWTKGWQGEESEGIRLLQQALEISRGLDDKVAIAETLWQLGNLYAHTDRYTEAKAVALEGLTIGQQLEQFGIIIRASDTLGLLCFRLGESEEAEQYYRQALSLAEEIGHWDGIMRAAGGLGLVGLGGDEQKARAMLPYVEQSLAISRRMGHQLEISARLNILGQLHEKLGNYADAIAYCGAGVQAAQAADNPFFTCFNLNVMATVARKLSDFADAKQYMVQSIQTAIEADVPKLMRTGLSQASDLLLAEAEFATDEQEQMEMRIFVLALLTCHVQSRTPDIAASSHVQEQITLLETLLPASVANDATARGRGWTVHDAAHKLLNQFAP
ncbi:tetratricopeptide repeat protein [Chloroflexi bacterium TSY]|nr:tetratricopeptide repeat protein [Chloroflexi bacterium TSY]